MYVHLAFYLASFFILWFGAGLIISSIDRFSKKLKLSSFAFSFFALGILTSIPEFAVGMTALADNTPEVFVGNLIGGIPVIFLLIIPILAIFGNGIKLKNQLGKTQLAFSFMVMITPAFLVMDRTVTNPEGIIMILLYGILFLIIQRKNGIFDTKGSKILSLRSYSLTDIFKILLGVALIFIASNIVVDNTLYFAGFLHISPFVMSLLFLSFGTNLPELSIAIKSILTGKKDVAFGDYVGSAAANTLLFGIFTLINKGNVVTVNNFLTTFIVMCIGLTAFFYFTLSKNDISRREGFLLLIIYAMFILSEFFPFG